MSTNWVEFTPDPEPYKDGVEEDTGIDSVTASVNIYYCPKCKDAKFDSIDNIEEREK